MEYETEVAELLSAKELEMRGLKTEQVGPQASDSTHHTPGPAHPWPVYVLLRNGRVFGCDLVVSATGVSPNTSGLVGPQGRVKVSL